MKLKQILTRFLTAITTVILVTLSGAITARAQVPPQLLHYQGRVADNNGNFNGPGQFKFALVNADGTVSYWSNDGQSGVNLEPTAHVPLTVDHGLFSVLLGDAGTVIPYATFDNTDVRLRVWFRPPNGNGPFQMFTPDQRIVSVGYAFNANRANTVPWSGITGVPADLANGDDNTIYSAGQGLSLSGTTFSLNTTFTDDRYWRRSGNNIGVGDFLGSLNATPLELRAPGGLRISDTTPSLSFGNQTKQMLNLYGSTYGLGVQNFTAYSRSHGGYAWYRDGIHSDLANDPGAGGVRLLTLEGSDNQLTLFQNDGQPGTILYGNESTTGGGALSLRKADGNPGFRAFGGNPGGLLELYQADGDQGAILYGDSANGGALSLRKPDGTAGVRAWGAAGNNGGQIAVMDSTGTETVEIRGAGDASNQGGQIIMRQANGTATVQLDAEAANVGGGGYLALYKSDGTASIVLRADQSGNGRITTQVLQITGGSDLSEQFHVTGDSGEPQPGMLVSIDAAHPGQLVESSKPYDRTVAGVVSGAGGVRPGMLMGQLDWPATGRHPVALSGRVYCKVDADHGAIQPGDLITTSATPGHGMKVTDHTRAQGAIIGKAMTALSSGRGLVLVLVSLQ